jgi:coenzyme F420 biosynthesis associated uncharacterized protein
MSERPDRRPGDGRQPSGAWKRPAWRRDAFLQAGLLVGAAIGAGITVLGRRMERSARRGLVDWPQVARIAVGRARRAEGSLPKDELAAAEPVYAAAMREVVPALEAALETRLPGVVERAGVVSRADWVRANVSTFAGLVGRIEGRLLDEAVPPGSGIVRSGMTIANRAVTTRQLGYLLGFLGQRVLGQYDLALLSAEATPGRLMFVDENIRRVAETLEVPLDPFRTWIVLHETTHAFEFEGQTWLRPYLAGRFEEQLDSMASGVSVMSREALRGLRRSLREEGAGQHWLEDLMTDEQRRGFHEIQAVMSLLEGFSDYVMDRVGADLVYDVERISERFHARRAQRTGFERVMMRLTGLDLKMEQYRLGEAFVAEVARARGSEGLRAMWRGPECLPDLEEIKAPELWLARVMPDSGPAYS